MRGASLDVPRETDSLVAEEKQSLQERDQRPKRETANDAERVDGMVVWMATIVTMTVTTAGVDVDTDVDADDNAGEGTKEEGKVEEKGALRGSNGVAPRDSHAPVAAHTKAEMRPRLPHPAVSQNRPGPRAARGGRGRGHSPSWDGPSWAIVGQDGLLHAYDVLSLPAGCGRAMGGLWEAIGSGSDGSMARGIRIPLSALAATAVADCHESQGAEEAGKTTRSMGTGVVACRLQVQAG